MTVEDLRNRLNILINDGHKNARLLVPNGETWLFIDDAAIDEDGDVLLTEALDDGDWDDDAETEEEDLEESDDIFGTDLDTDPVEG